MRRAGVVLLLVLILAGCGGGDDDGDALTKAEYEQRTEEIYAELGRSLQVPLETTEQRRAAAPRVGDAMRAVADDMDAIEPPEEIAGPHDAYVAALRGCADRFEDELQRNAAKDEVFADLLKLDCVLQMRDALGEMADKGYRGENPFG
jgi:hypothetical protein